MANQKAVNFTISAHAADIKNVRIAGASKPLEQLTISELVQLRPGSAAEDAGSYNVNAVSSDVTISTSSALSELAQTAGIAAVRNQLSTTKVQTSLTNANIVAQFPGDIKQP
jgi:hypothetical protein